MWRTAQSAWAGVGVGLLPITAAALMCLSSVVIPQSAAAAPTWCEPQLSNNYCDSSDFTPGGVIPDGVITEGFVPTDPPDDAPQGGILQEVIPAEPPDNPPGIIQEYVPTDPPDDGIEEYVPTGPPGIIQEYVPPPGIIEDPGPDTNIPGPGPADGPGPGPGPAPGPGPGPGPGPAPGPGPGPAPGPGPGPGPASSGPDLNSPPPSDPRTGSAPAPDAPKLPASADITRAPVATHRVVPGEPSQLPPPDAVPPSAAAALQLSNPAVVPGEPVSGQGYGCPPESPVALSVGGTPAGETVADSNGAFQSTFHMQTVTEGRYQVTADCGAVLLAAPLDVVLVSNVNAATSTLTVIVFFLLIGVFVYMRRLLNPPARKVVGK